MIPLLIVLLSWIAIEIEVAIAINAQPRRFVHRATTVSTKLYWRAMGPRADIDPGRIDRDDRRG
jgi:hypothetical protein